MLIINWNLLSAFMNRAHSHFSKKTKLLMSGVILPNKWISTPLEISQSKAYRHSGNNYSGKIIYLSKEAISHSDP